MYAGNLCPAQGKGQRALKSRNYIGANRRKDNPSETLKPCELSDSQSFRVATRLGKGRRSLCLHRIWRSRVAGGMVVDSKTFHERFNKKHVDQLPMLGETLLNLCDVPKLQWTDVTNDVRQALGRE